jgi:hypothetical protein
MATYTVTLTDAQDKALHYVAHTPQEWIQNAIEVRCQHAINEIVNMVVEQNLANNTPIVGSTKEEIVLNADLTLAADRHTATLNS